MTHTVITDLYDTIVEKYNLNDVPNGYGLRYARGNIKELKYLGYLVKLEDSVLKVTNLLYRSKDTIFYSGVLVYKEDFHTTDELFAHLDKIIQKEHEELKNYKLELNQQKLEKIKDDFE